MDENLASFKKLRKRKRYKIAMASLVFVLAFLAYAYTTFLIPSKSMLPGLKPGDHILAERTWLAYPFGRIPSRGDIIVFTLPEEIFKDSGSEPVAAGPKKIGVFRYKGEVLIKRVAGLPGETVQMQDNALYVNGTRVELPGETIPPDPAADDPGSYGVSNPLKLGPDELFVLGDNRSVSEDSRYWGPLKRDRIIGRYVRVLFHSEAPKK
jgi:signal peptidase I